MKSTSIGELAKALGAAQAEMHGAVKDATNPFFKSKYADLESVWEALRPVLAKNGLSVSQTMEESPNGGVLLTTTLMHISDQWIEGSQPVFATKQDPQGLGSAITYARRYGLAAICGVVQVDDDGQAASQPRKQEPASKLAKVEPSPAPVYPPDDEAQQRFNEAPKVTVGGLAPGEDFGNYLVTFGKYEKKTLREIAREVGRMQLQGYVNYIRNDASKKGKPVGGEALQFCNNAEAFLSGK